MKKLLVLMLSVLSVNAFANSEIKEFVREEVEVTRVYKDKLKVFFCYKYNETEECLKASNSASHDEFIHMQVGDVITIKAKAKSFVDSEDIIAHAIDIHGLEIPKFQD
jgi:hypothetical protein